MDFAQLRASIPATKASIYMNTGFTGPSPSPVVERIREAIERESTVGPASVEGLAQTRQATHEAQEEAAALLNADVEEVLLTHGTTEGVHVVLHGLSWSPGDEVVTCSLEHPAIATPTAVLEQRHGVTVKRVETPPAATSKEMVSLFEQAITPRTKIVAVSHVQYTCGLRLPIEEMTKIAHRNGALVLIDGAQTGGQINVDVRQLGVDFYAISGQKWLLGPNGTGAMYVNRAHFRALEPLFTTHELADRRAGPRPESEVIANPLGRFRMTSHNSALLGGFAESIKIMRSVGLDAIEARSKALGQRLKAGARRLEACALTGPQDNDVSCGLVSIAIDGWQPAQLVDELWNKWHIACRAVNNPPAIRFSCAAFNTEDEVDTVLEALSEAEQSPPPPTS